MNLNQIIKKIKLTVKGTLRKSDEKYLHLKEISEEESEQQSD